MVPVPSTSVRTWNEKKQYQDPRIGVIGGARHPVETASRRGPSRYHPFKGWYLGTGGVRVVRRFFISTM